jgi:hypothetical protein
MYLVLVMRWPGPRVQRLAKQMDCRVKGAFTPVFDGYARQ